MSLNSKHTICSGLTIETGTPFVYDADAALNAALAFHFSGTLYIRTETLVNVPSIKVEVHNLVLAGVHVAEVIDKTHATTEAAMEAYSLGYQVAAAEGHYSASRDSTGPIHPGVKITLTCSGVDAEIDVDAELIIHGAS